MTSIIFFTDLIRWISSTWWITSDNRNWWFRRIFRYRNAMTTRRGYLWRWWCFWEMRKARRQHNIVTRKFFNNINKQLYHLILFFTYLLIIDCINIVANRRIKLDFPKKFSGKIQHPLKTFYFLYKIRPMGTHQKIGRPRPAQPMVFCWKIQPIRTPDLHRSFRGDLHLNQRTLSDTSMLINSTIMLWLN